MHGMYGSSPRYDWESISTPVFEKINVGEIPEFNFSVTQSKRIIMLNEAEKNMAIKGLIQILCDSPTMVNEEGDPEKLLRPFVKRYNRWVKKSRNPALHENEAKDMWTDTLNKIQDLNIAKLVYKKIGAFKNINFNTDEIKIIVDREGKKEELDGNWLAVAAEEMLN